METIVTASLPYQGEQKDFNVKVVWYNSVSKRTDRQGMVQTGSVAISITVDDYEHKESHIFKGAPGSPAVTEQEALDKAQDLIARLARIFENRYQVFASAADGGNWGYFGNNDM